MRPLTFWLKMKWMLIGQLILLLFVYVNIALWAGEYFDNVCVEGRFSAQQAEAHNILPWGKCPKYRMRENGECRAEERDRVYKHYCSGFMRDFMGRDNPTWTRIRDAIQEQVLGRRL